MHPGAPGAPGNPQGMPQYGYQQPPNNGKY